MDCHFLLQGIFPTQEWNPHLLNCRQIVNPLSYKGNPRGIDGAIQNITWRSPLLHLESQLSPSRSVIRAEWGQRERVSRSTNHPSGTGPHHRERAEGEITVLSWILGSTQQVSWRTRRQAEDCVLQGSRVLATAAHRPGASPPGPSRRPKGSGISMGHSPWDPHSSLRSLGAGWALGTWLPQ